MGSERKREREREKEEGGGDDYEQKAQRLLYIQDPNFGGTFFHTKILYL